MKKILLALAFVASLTLSACGTQCGQGTVETADGQCVSVNGNNGGDDDEEEDD